MIDTSCPMLVLGDVMLDRHVYGHVRRISPEGPVPVVSLTREFCSPGGAGHVAASIAGLGCPVTLAGLIGNDLDGDRLRTSLQEKGVIRLVTTDQPVPKTISKTRILSDSHQQMLRLDQDGNRLAFMAASEELLVRTLDLVPEHRAVILADYDKGVITPHVAQAVIKRCREQSIPCIVDPKKSDFTVYSRATILTPNLLESERALGRPLDNDEAIARAAQEMRIGLGLEAMLITRGADGMTLATSEKLIHLPAQAREVADVTGAGDTVVAVLAACLGSGVEITEACRMAGIAAGIAVSHSGTYVVRAGELDAAWRGVSPKVLDQETARQRLIEARRKGQRVVFTNGCFDILHAGHLACLEAARRLGDVLVIGLNSDVSVRGLKGHTRPIISQNDRAALLAGLASVDLVVIFDEPTPALLVEQLEPDVLVKGGDYHADQIAGGEFVRSRGGRIVTIPLVPGLSTTAIVSGRK